MTGRLLLRAAIAAITAAMCVAAPGIVTYTFDEFGNGQITDGLHSNLLPFGTMPDPGPGGLANVLYYQLLGPPGLIDGDLLIYEPGTSNLSDILRFNSTILGGVVFVYSDTDDLNDRALADVGFPNLRNPITFSIEESGTEEINGISYVPIPGQPGFVAGAPDVVVTYNFISDAPEPSSIWLFAVGAAALLFGLRRARR